MEKITLDIGWVIGSGVALFVSSFGVGYRYCKNQKEPVKEIKLFSCDIVHTEYVESMTYSGYPIILTGYKRAKAHLRDGVPYWVECRHFRAEGMMCGVTHAPCLLKDQLPANRPKTPSILSAHWRLLGQKSKG